MDILTYIAKLASKYGQNLSTEHTFRGILEELLRGLLPEEMAIINEPKRIACGAPDFLIKKVDSPNPIGYIEAKDIGARDLKGENKKVNKEQFDRYKDALDNIIFTDYLEFHFYNRHTLINSIKIAELQDGVVVPLTENFALFKSLIKNFSAYLGQAITSPELLAKIMAGKARLLADLIERALNSKEDSYDNKSLHDQLNAFKAYLIHNITIKAFADVYAQTLVYGMFAARLHDPTLETFSRQEAAELIPKSNPFLRKLFGHIAGPDIDDRIKWIVDDLADVFLICNVEEILQNYGRATKMEDPIIHFYETFLSEYDPELRKARGVWYTPQPIVTFIVRAVDEVLKNSFGLKRGLGDTSKTKIKVNTQGTDNRYKDNIKKVEREVHKVQVLDPATGTGTFLAEVIKHIHKKFKGQEGLWNSYVPEHLLPRLNGFELLMASYTMAHLQLDLLLKETGFNAPFNQRLHVYLTNSLEEHHEDAGTLWSAWLSDESSQADQIKRDTPVMCVLGNPPYSAISSNKGAWMDKLLEDYKKEPGGKVKLKERKHWLNDDYVKFIRYGQYYVEKNGTGVLAYITPHGFLDNPTFRGMRWHLLDTFDQIYVIDLHGNAKKKEVSPNGSRDVNVFDIQQGVSINIFVKTGKKKKGELAEVFHYDLYGERQHKYDFLQENSLNSIQFQKLENRAPMYFMVPKDFKLESDYNKGFSVQLLFPLNSVGVVTANDRLNISMTEDEQQLKIIDLLTLEENTWRIKYERRNDAQSWKYTWAKDDAEANKEKELAAISYRPFDQRVTLYTGKSGGVYARPQKGVMQHFLKGENIGLALCKQFKAGQTYQHVFISDKVMESSFVSNKTSEITSLFPLYLYPTENGQTSIDDGIGRRPNLDAKIVKKIAEGLNLNFVAEQEEDDKTFAPIDLLDYIYAVLHSPAYREKYKEFLKIDFPRVPYPKDKEKFWALVDIGRQIRELHLLEAKEVEDFITGYPTAGDNEVSRKITKKEPGFVLTDQEKGIGQVWINDQQYFDKVPIKVWEFYIGGYQPAQKWLKDRNGQKLTYEDIFHYQKIVVALSRTIELMEEVDRILDLS